MSCGDNNQACGDNNQEPKSQWSSKTGREKQEPHSRQGEYVRKKTNLWPQISLIQRQESLSVKLTRTHSTEVIIS